MRAATEPLPPLEFEIVPLATLAPLTALPQVIERSADTGWGDWDMAVFQADAKSADGRARRLAEGSFHD